MPYAIEAYEAGTCVGRTVVDGTEEQAIEGAKELSPPPNVTFVRVIQIAAEGDVNGPEIWSERRDA